MRRLVVPGLVFALTGLLGAACSSGDDSSSSDTGDDTTSQTGGGGEPSQELGQGVTSDTIKIGFTYLDLDDIREAGLIDTNHGPYDEHIGVLVDDVNANGGINGRMLEVTSLGYDPLDVETSQANCLEFTEDLEVFAVLGSHRGEAVLCYTEQHETVAVSDSFMTAERLSRASSPYAAAGATQERIAVSFVEEAAEAGLFEGKTLAVHATEPENHDLATEIVVPALEDAGVDVVVESLIEGTGGDVGSASEQAVIKTEAMRAEDVDAVFVVGDSLLISNSFVAEGFAPSMFYSEMGSLQALAGDENTDLSVFDAVYTYGNYTDHDEYLEETFQTECVPLWDAANPDDTVNDPNDIPEDAPNHMVGLGVACRTLKIFVEAATAAGDVLNNDTFQGGLEAVGEFDLPTYGPASIGPDKLDAQDDLVMWVYDPPSSDSKRGLARYEG